MASPPIPTPPPSTIQVRIGGWFEARATGWGVLAVPVLLAMVLGAAVLRSLGA